jgi:hypothetical protein
MSLLKDLLQDPTTRKVYLLLARLGPTQSKTPWDLAFESGLARSDVQAALATLKQAGIVTVVDYYHREGGVVDGYLLDRAAAQKAQAAERPLPKPGPRTRPSGLAERAS